MLSSQIRKIFLDYFVKNDHIIKESSSLLPQEDSSLLFTNSGMVQFKNYFYGRIKADCSKVATIQKCMRAGGKHNDLQNVGYTSRHHTFFEMLGNFSFGDYFKEEAIYLAWYFLTKIINIDQKKLYITVHHSDNTSLRLWKKITGFSENKIIIINSKDNFWTMSNTGPCGPSTEIFYDNGPHLYGGLPGSRTQDGERYVEIWNIVFMEYEMLSSGKLISLSQKSIDTGMGLERITAVLQGVHDNYDTDLFKPIIDMSKRITNNQTSITSHKVIADHVRSICFLLSEGIIPTNEGRGYVVRRIIRRSIKHSNSINAPKNFLHSLVSLVISQMSDTYIELKKVKPFIINTLLNEEEQFEKTIHNGKKFLTSALNQVGKDKVLSGKEVFKLYDTYGFPVDLTNEFLQEKGFTMDLKGFELALEQQRINSKPISLMRYDQLNSGFWHDIYQKYGGTKFLYNKQEANTVILAIIIDNISVQFAYPDKKAIIITKETPFYAESGGQVGDQGLLNDHSNIIDTHLLANKIHGHVVNPKRILKVGDRIQLRINVSMRKKIAVNHSATHLLNYALRSVLGKHVIQKGSLVDMEKLRFDFSHFKPLSNDEIIQIERLVNNIIINNIAVCSDNVKLNTAKKEGIIHSLETKYDDEVTVVSIDKSKELCCGTHVQRTGEIGYFCLIKEESVAYGIRRIEGFTGEKSVQYVRDKIDMTHQVSRLMKCNDKVVTTNIQKLLNNYASLQKQNERLDIQILIDNLDITKIRRGDLYIAYSHGKTIDIRLLFQYLNKNGKPFVLLVVGTDSQKSKILLSVAVTKDLSNSISAKNLVSSCLDIIDGKGGGTINIAQASGNNLQSGSDVVKRLKNILI